jgi:hypothetical protein
VRAPRGSGLATRSRDGNEQGDPGGDARAPTVR